MFYIIEGCDGTGKTTLVNKLLATHPGAKMVHFTAPANATEARNYWKKYVAAIIENKNEKVVIFDRCWYSDMVYGPVLRGKADITELECSMLEHLILSCGGGTVFWLDCLAKTAIARAFARSEDLIKPEMFEELLARYTELFVERNTLPIIHVDTECSFNDWRA